MRQQIRYRRTLSEATRHRRPTLLLAATILTLATGCAGLSDAGYEDSGELRLAANYPVIPRPHSVRPAAGAFVVNGATTVRVSRGEDATIDVAELVASAFATVDGVPLHVAPAGPDDDVNNSIVLLLADDANDADDADDANIADAMHEGYELVVTPEYIEVRARSERGLFYGAQTILQLAMTVASADGQVFEVPAVAISDAPRFAYRGMHLDVGRHLFPVSFIKRYIALMARYKFNTFHWHLTEDQGWRIEILRYPELTRIGAYREETILEKNFDPYVGDGEPYGGFYTQDEVRDVVAFAAAHFVTIIPEIEMPGHSVAALAAYPDLACTSGPFTVRTVWGVASDIYCPSEETFEFLENVLIEVMDLFPSRYIHIGGDEAPKRAWEESDLAQSVIQRENLADEHELQSYFIRRIESFLLDHDRRLIGWDEILEGGLAPQATVMSWRGTSGGIEAARQGHDVIMTPNSHLYFDHYQGDPEFEPLAIGGRSTLENVYSYEPIPDELTDVEARHVLGAQANVWTEYIKTSEHVEYMVLPRMLALAEVVWSDKGHRDFDSFTARLPAHFGWFDNSGYNYRLPTIRGLEGDKLSLSTTFVLRLDPIPGVDIHYSVDGSEPTFEHPRYDRPVAIDIDPSGTVITARAISPGGHTGPLARSTVRRGVLAPAFVSSAELQQGVSYRVFEGLFTSVNGLSGRTPAATGTMETVGLPNEFANGFGAVFEGYLAVPDDGIYEFALVSDDGSQLQLDGRIVVDHDGLHGATQKSGATALESGLHAMAVLYFEAGGGKELRLLVRRVQEDRPESTWRDVPASWYRYR